MDEEYLEVKKDVEEAFENYVRTVGSNLVTASERLMLAIVVELHDISGVLTDMLAEYQSEIGK